MSFWTFKKKPYPILAFAASIFFIVFGLVMARNAHFSWFLLGAYVWLFLFGCRKGCLHVIGPFFLCGGIFGVIAYFAYGRNFASALAMVNRFGAVFLSIALGMSMEPIDMTRNLSTLRVPRGITLGMLIATSFPPVLRAEKQRVREAMQTRGAGTVLMASRIESDSTVYRTAAEKMAAIADRFQVFGVELIAADGSAAPPAGTVTIGLRADSTYNRNQVAAYLLGGGRTADPTQRVERRQLCQRGDRAGRDHHPVHSGRGVPYADLGVYPDSGRRAGPCCRCGHGDCPHGQAQKRAKRA